MQKGLRGSPAGKALMARAVEEASEAGFTCMRLGTPTGQVRARRFYEREGWTQVAEIEDTPLGFPVVEYRRPCRIPS